MTYPSEAYSWASLETEIKLRLRVPGSAEDELLQDATELGLDLADRYINRDIVDDDGDDIDITTATYRSLKSGVIEYVRLCREQGELIAHVPTSVRAYWNHSLLKLVFI